MSGKKREEKQNERMKDTVHLYAKLWGISVEGVRYYNEKGIIHTDEKQHKQGYRMYGPEESTAVVTCRKYRKLGFSLERIKMLFFEKSAEKTAQMFRCRRDELEKEIREKQKLLISVNQKIEQMDGICKFNENQMYRMVMRPAFWFHPTRIDFEVQDMPDEVNVTSYWNKNLSPHAESMTLWPLERFESGEGSIYNGLCIQEEFVTGMPPGKVMYFPEERCLYGTVQVKGFTQALENVFDGILAYMQKKGIKPTGAAAARRIRFFIDEKQDYFYEFEVFVPCCNKEEE